MKRITMNTLVAFAGAALIAALTAVPTTRGAEANKTKAKPIFARDAAGYVGRTKTVVGTIVGTYLSKRSGNLYLNFGEDYRNSLSIKIPKDALSKFRADAPSYYKGKRVAARGVIKKERQYLRMVISDPARMKVLKSAGAKPAVKKAAAAAKAVTVPKGAISWQDAANYLNQKKSVSGTIVGTYLSSRSGTLYLNFHPDYRTYLSVKIPKEDLPKFPADAPSYYQDKKVIATGMIVKDRRYLRIIVKDPADLKVIK